MFEDGGLVFEDGGLVFEDDGLVFEDDGLVFEDDGLVFEDDGAEFSITVNSVCDPPRSRGLKTSASFQVIALVGSPKAIPTNPVLL
ncbi:MAG: hypothetical protein GKS00_22330 [Alphaproteobacteria bacterium]|nr:hypothetical protein [Alphaproteobacteria bacterium]